MPVLDIEKVDRLKQILKWHPRGITISDLAAKMDMNRNLVAKYLDMLLISGQVDMEVVGAAKVYFLSRRVPISSMLEFSSDMVIVLDREQKIVQVNDPLLRMLGEKKDALMGRHIRDLDNPFFRAVPITGPSKDTDDLGQVREMVCTLEGKKHHFRVKQLQTAFEDGNQGITLIIEDISAQVMYQEMLEINEARYRGIVEDQTEFITRFLPDQKLIFVNDAYARYLGKNKEELLGGLHIPNLGADDIPAVSRSIRSLSKENPVVTFECRIHHACGKDRWNLWTVRVLFDDENKPVEYQGIGRDNTEKREAAARINQYIKDMEFLSRKAQEFVEVPPEADLYQLIGEGLSELLPHALIGVNSFDMMSESFIATAFLPDEDHNLLNTLLGREFMGFEFPFSAIPQAIRTLVYDELLKGKLFHSDESLYTLFFQQIPEDTCERIRKTLNLGDRHYAIGLARHGILFGAVNFTLRESETPRNPQLIETFIRQASVILHRRLTEESLRRSEDRYKGIVEDQTECIVRFQPDWTITFANGSFCRYFQKNLQELTGRPIFSLIGNDSLTSLACERVKSLTAQNPVNSYEYRDLDPSGSIRWSIWTTRAILDENGILIEYQSVGRDITGQKEAEAKIRQYIADREFLTQTALGFMNLKDDENLYQYIADQILTLIPDQVVAVSSIDPTERTVTLQSVAGLDESALEEFRNLGVFLFGKTFSLDRDPDVEAILKTKYLTPGPALYNLLFREFPQEVCIRLGKRIGFGKSYVMGFVHEGTIFGSVVLVLRPGQELKNKEILELFLNQASIALLHQHARQELRNSEKIYRSVIENIQDVFYRSDTAGNLIMASPSWAKMLGYASLEDCIGYDIAEKFWFEPELRKEFLDAINRNGSVSDYEVVLKCRDGSPLYVSTNSHLYYDDAGSLLGVEGIFRDITERRTAAERIRDTLSQIEFFSQKLQEFIELPPDSDIYCAIGQGLKELLPDGMIVVNCYDRSTGKLTIKALVGDKARATALKYLHSDLTGISLQVDEPVPENIQAGKIYPVKGNFYSILSRNFSQDISTTIVQELDLGNFYYISLVWGGSLLGNVTFGLPKGRELEKIPFIEIYGRAASIVLQREIAEESLKKSREIFSNVATYAPVPIAIIEADGRYQFVNQKFTEVFGYDLHDFTMGKEWFSLAYPDPEYRKKVIDSWKSDLKASMSGQQRPEIFTVRCKNGLDREILFRPVSLSDGKECVVYEDVTELHKTEEIQRLLSSIVETSRDAIISKKTDGIILSWNKAAEQLYGYTKDEMIGRNISTIIPQERLGEMSEILDRIKKGDSVDNLETLRVRRDGKIIDVAVTISPITNEAGIVIGASTIGRDISFKKSEERLLESEEKYRTIVENMKIGMYRSTGDPKGRFVWGNTSLLDILGYPSFDTLSQIDVADLFAEPGGREMLLADLRQSGFVMNREIYLRRADGSRICVRVTALARYNLAGDIEFINGTVEDITEHKKDAVHLQLLRQELLDIIEFFPDPAFLIDQHHQVFAWNSAMEHLTGVSRNEVIGSSRYDRAFATNGTPQPVLIDLLEAPDDEIGNAYSPVTREGSSLIAEGFIPSFYSGRGAYVWMKASPLHDPEGNKIGAIEIIRDISKVKETGKSLHYSTISGSDEREMWSMLADANHGFPDQGTIDPSGILSPLYLSQALKTAQDYIAILDKSGKCLWANDSLVHAVKAENSSDLAGRSLALFIAPEFRKLALNCLSDARKNGHKIIPLMMLSSSGRIPVEASISSIMAKNGNFFGFLTVARNVEREKVERPR